MRVTKLCLGGAIGYVPQANEANARVFRRYLGLRVQVEMCHGGDDVNVWDLGDKEIRQGVDGMRVAFAVARAHSAQPFRLVRQGCQDFSLEDSEGVASVCNVWNRLIPALLVDQGFGTSRILPIRLYGHVRQAIGSGISALHRVTIYVACGSNYANRSRSTGARRHLSNLFVVAVSILLSAFNRHISYSKRWFKYDGRVVDNDPVKVSARTRCVKDGEDFLVSRSFFFAYHSARWGTNDGRVRVGSVRYGRRAFLFAGRVSRFRVGNAPKFLRTMIVVRLLVNRVNALRGRAVLSIIR